MKLISLNEVRQAIAEARQKAGISQAEAAERAGVSQPFWHKVENLSGFPNQPISPKTLEKLAVSVGLEVGHGYHLKKLSKK